MHGRKKVQRTAEEEDIKQKERCKKMQAYQFAMGLIFKKRKNKEFDSELLQVISNVLMVNPDITTLWNIRKESFLHIRSSQEMTEDELSKSAARELALTEQCLKINPKSYGAWHHRLWIMRQTNFKEIDNEIKLCAKFLSYDDRNFHCWDYRRYLLGTKTNPPMNLEEELNFTTEKIVSNFSNYSSWHLRSKILPQLTKDFLKDELELIKNAAFTDPNDQSVWFYYRWLLMSHLASTSPSNHLKFNELEIQKKSSEFLLLLESELEWVTELSDFETENKWTKLTLILLMRLIDHIRFKSKIFALLETLKILDPQRFNYYTAQELKYENEYLNHEKC